ncbi:hypothetical protein LTR05_007513 [Lithohypha guttulata]|uniref:Uncharacterized protein n=1 Tax=Lithohypha guttulata TaxID=1690604 RepID=A0AAN7SV67_9EURO|nr:hypothetical protein LTR05_007513 [Lithohypha guttulata]
MNSFTTPVLEKYASSPLLSTPAEDEHIVITGNTRSWDAARKLPGFDHGWEQYAIVDDQIKNMMRPIDRLSIYNARRWLKYVSAAFAERDLSLLPVQLYPTAAQYEHQKDGIVNAVPFPHIRTRIILNPDKFLHDDFWALATTELRFLWKSNMEDGYTRNARTGLFEFTPEFHKCLNDPNCWALTSDFFDAFPEFHGEAKVFETPFVVS